MMLRVSLLWIAGGLVIVPYSIYRLLFEAQPEEYALLIVFPLFWVFGFWGVAGPLVAGYRIHRFMKSLERVQNRRELQETFENNDGREVLVYLIASENHIPKFLVRVICGRVEKRLMECRPADSGGAGTQPGTIATQPE